MTIKVNGGGNGKQRSAQDEARQAFQKREEELAKGMTGHVLERFVPRANGPAPAPTDA